VTKSPLAVHVTFKGDLVNVYRPMVWKERCVSASGRWETILKIILNNLKSFIKKILKWLRDLDFVAEDRDK